MISVILLIFGTFISTANAAQMAMGGGYWIHNLNGPKPSDAFLGELAKGLPIIGIISHKKSLITIFGHKHKIKNFIKKFDIFHFKNFNSL